MMKNLWKRMEHYTSSKDNVYIIPNKNGFKFLGINFFLFLIAMTYGNNMALLISFSMSVFLILQMFTTHRIINNLKLKTLETHNQYINQQHSCFCHFTEYLPEDIKKFIQLELITQKDNIFGQYLKSFEGHHRFALNLSNRGLYRINKVKFFTTGPGNLFYVWRYFPVSQKLSIYPERLPIDFKIFSQDKSKNLITNESEFSQHIRYQPGLNIKRIDWKVYAKTDVLYWKKFIDYDQNIYAVDFNKLTQDTETRLRHMSYLIDRLTVESKVFKVILPQTVLPPSSGRQHFNKCMELISDYKV